LDGNLRTEWTTHATAGRNNHGDPILEKDLGQTGSPPQAHVFISIGQEESKELEADMRRMGCLGLLEKSWRVRREEMVRKLVTGEVDQVYASTIRA